ncbi:MAG: ATP-binding cassette subfamily B multidrug efflux pump, partial [Arcticibacterium sp.]
MSRQKETGNAFDRNLFKRLLQFTKPYSTTFYGVALAAIILSGFAVLRPVLVGSLVDQAIKMADAHKLLTLTLLMLVVLIGEVLSQLAFNYFANWLGESVIRDVRVKLFKHMTHFKMAY